MTQRNRLGRCLVACLLFAGSLTGCQGWNKTMKGAALGSLGGGGLGAIIGHQSGNRDKGALIGALAGGAGGALLGNAADKADERDAAIAQTHFAQQQARADAHALTNRDVIMMSRKRMSDSLIISTIQKKGGRFDTSPDGLTHLQDMGVTEPVIKVMLQYDQSR